MKWFNHMVIAGATAAVVAPPLVPLAIIGSTAPDWLEWVAKATGRPVPHRGPTHWLAVWAVALAFFAMLWDIHGIGAAFAWGGLSHVLADSLTVYGVPFSPLSDRRFHLAGGRLRTGGAGEYMVAWGLVAVCFLAAGQLRTPAGYIPFFPDWAARYEAGTCTAKEWRDNRLRFF